MCALYFFLVAFDMLVWALLEDGKVTLDRNMSYKLSNILTIKTLSYDRQITSMCLSVQSQMYEPIRD